MLRLAGRIAGVDARVSAIPPMLIALLARVNPLAREVCAVCYQLYRPFVVDSSAFERAFGVYAMLLEEALTTTVAWFQARAHERRPGRGAAIAKALGVFVVDNLLIGLAILAVRFLVRGCLRCPRSSSASRWQQASTGFRRCVARRCA